MIYTQSIRPFNTETLDQELSCHTYLIFAALTDEQRCLASDAVAIVHYPKSQKARKKRIPKEGDMMVVRHHAVE